MEFEKRDVAIGAFVLGAALVFLATFVAINRERLTSQTYTVGIHLPNIAGIDKGVEVIYKGYKAGAVERVTIEYEPEFRFVVGLAIKKEIRLRAGTIVMTRNKGWGGSKFLELIPPAEGESGRVIEAGEVLPVVPEMDLMAKANEVMGEVQKLVKDLQKGGAGADLQLTIQHAKSAVANLDHVLVNMNLMLAENRAAIKGASANANVLLEKNSEAMTRAMQRLDQTMTHMPQLMMNVEELTAELKAHPWRLVRKGEPDKEVVHVHDHPVVLSTGTAGTPPTPAPR